MKGTLILLLVVAGLGVALWWSERTEADQIEVGPQPVAALDGRSLYDAVTLALSGQPDVDPVEFARAPGLPWQLTEPVEDVVSRSRLESVFDVFGDSQLIPVSLTEEERSDPAQIAQMGLEAPRAFLEASWPDGHRTRFEIGLEGPFGSDLFVRRDGEIWRGELALFTCLQGTPDDWRERFVFGHQGPEARMMVLDRALGSDALEPDAEPTRERLVLRRKGAEGWRLMEPFDLRLDPGRAETLVGALLGLQVGSFLRGRPGDMAGPIDPDAKADVEIQVQGSRGMESVSLTRLEGAGQFLGHSASRNLWFLVDSPPYAQAVEVPLQDVRAQYLLTTPVGDARSLRITRPDGDVLELERDAGGAYRLVRPISMKVDPTAANELLGAIRKLYTVRFVEDDAEDLARYGLDSEQRTLVEMLDRRGRVNDALLLGAAARTSIEPGAQPSVYVKRADERHVVEVDQQFADAVARPWTAYVDRQVTSLPSGGSVQRIVCRSDGRERALARDERGNWIVEGGSEVDAGLLFEVADNLRGLRGESVSVASQVVADRSPDAVVQMIGPTGTVLVELGIYDAAEGGDWCVLSRREDLAYRLGGLTSRNLRLLRP